MNEREPEVRRELVAAALVVVGVALIGVLAGTRPGSYAPLLPDRAAPSDSPSDGPVQPARSYTELMARPWGLGQSYGSGLQRVLAGSSRERVPSTDSQAKALAMEARAQHRAFAGAPPSIPHPVGQGNGAECNTCHVQGGMLGNALAPPMSHLGYAQCTQCHVPERSAVPASQPVFSVASTFQPLQGAPAPSRWSEAPPQIPHTTQMRERCDSCHGPYGRHGLQSSHSERQSCQQCHAPSAQVDQMPEAR